MGAASYKTEQFLKTVKPKNVLGRELLEYIKQRNITINQLSDFLGIDSRSIADHIRGKHIPQDWALDTYSYFLNINTRDLLRDTDECDIAGRVSKPNSHELSSSTLERRKK